MYVSPEYQSGKGTCRDLKAALGLAAIPKYSKAAIHCRTPKAAEYEEANSHFP